jgi:hypothetical protein
MARICAHAVSFFILISLTGCFGAIIDLEMEAPGYSIGPVSSEYFPDLVKNALPADEGELRVFGKAHWGDFQTSWPNKVPFVGYSFYFSGVAALTDTNIILLLFNEDEQRYEIMTQVPYRFISFVPNWGWAGHAGLVLYFEKLGGFSFGEHYYSPAVGRTLLEFRKPNGIQRAPEKNKLAHLLFEEKVAIKHIEHLSDDQF